MQLIKCAHIIVGFFAICGCTQGSAQLTDDPHGRWATNEGHELSIRYDGTYTFCYQEKCESGKLVHDGDEHAAVMLVNFDKMKVTSQIRFDSRYDLTKKSEIKSGFIEDKYSKYELEIIPFNYNIKYLGSYYKWLYCDNNPCFSMDQSGRYDFMFIKEEEYYPPK